MARSARLRDATTFVALSKFTMMPGFLPDGVLWLCLGPLAVLAAPAGAAADEFEQFPVTPPYSSRPAASSSRPADSPDYPELYGIGGFEDPQYQGTGYFLDTEYGRYVYRHEAAYLSVLGGGSNPTAGPFARLTKKSSDFRVSGVYPFLHGDLPVTIHNLYTVFQLQVGLASSYTFSNWDTKSDIDVLRGAAAFRVDDLETSLWGIGPDVRLLFPPTSKGYRFFLGARFEGLGGRANPDATRLGEPVPGNRILAAKPTADVGKTDEIWGLRGEWSAGLMCANGVSVFGTVGLAKLRTKIITDNEENSDLFLWAVHVGIPTDVICRGTRGFWSRIGH